MNNINPWIGLNSYQEGQVIYGRSREIQDLSMSVFYNRQTVVYGRSGIGKSSLLHAGIFPIARMRGCLPISVRFDHASKISYRQQLIQYITDAVLAAGGVMRDTQIDQDAPQSLWEFFHRMQPQKDGHIITPLIVIDQFEEIFTLSKDAHSVRAFFEELADLFNDVMPDYLQLDGALQKSKETGSIFDGFQIKSTESYFEQEMSYHMVFVLREDYLSYLERYAVHIPALKQNRYGLLPITYRQAMEIITKPCEGLVSTEVADAIIRHITPDQDINDETPVDSAILSLYLSRLFDKKRDASTISIQLVEEQGESLIEDFYAEVVVAIDRKTIEYLEDVLINADGHRENVSIESLCKNEGISPSSMETLERAHLLRIFIYGNVRRVEFAHDVLCPIIVRRRSQRQNAARMRKAQRNGFFVMMVLFTVIFSSLYVIFERIDSKESLARQQARLNEMEVSLIKKGTDKMIDNHDYYGAIRLLINSLEGDLSNPSSNARKELDLRIAAYYALFSRDTCVAKVNYQFSLPYEKTAVISNSKRLIGINDNKGVAVIIDSHTGAVISCLSKHKVNPYDGVFAQENADNWKCFVEGDKIKFTCEDYDNSLTLTDISNDDKRCLIIADDTTLLDCWIFQGEEWWRRSDREFGPTRLYLHNIDDTIANAAYSNNGDTIAIQLCDNSYYMFNSKNGKEIITVNGIEQAKRIISQTKPRQLDLLKADIGNERVWYSIQINENILVQPTSIREIEVYHYNKKGIEHPDNIDIYQPSTKTIEKVRAHLDTLPLPSHLTHFPRSYYLDENGEKTDRRYDWPISTNKDETRLAILKPVWHNNYSISCIYASTGYQFFQVLVWMPVHTLHFSEDDQYLVVNYGEESQQLYYLPPLDQLVDSCKNMFFDWQMTEEERFQTYIHMND